MRLKCSFVTLAAHSILFCLLTGPGLAYAQTQTPKSSPDFNVGPAKDAATGVTPAGKDAVSLSSPTSQSSSPDRTVGPQQDGSIVVSDNQRLTPAGRIIELGSPVRAKAIALSPNSATHTGAVLLMGSPEPIIVFDTVTGRVLQRFIPTGATGDSPKGLQTGSFTGITYSFDGSKLLSARTTIMSLLPM